MGLARLPPARAAKNGKTLACLRRRRVAPLGATARQVLGAIIERIGWTARPGRPAGTCHPSIALLAEDTALSERAVAAGIRASVAAGWLTVAPRFADGHRATNRYSLPRQIYFPAAPPPQSSGPPDEPAPPALPGAGVGAGAAGVP